MAAYLLFYINNQEEFTMKTTTIINMSIFAAIAAYIMFKLIQDASYYSFIGYAMNNPF